MSSADGPLSASTSFGPIQLPASSQARAEQLLELDQMDEPGGSSNERSDTSSPIHQRQPPACPDCLHESSMNPHQAASFGSSCAPQPGAPRDDVCRCAFIVPNHTSPTNQPDQAQPEAPYLNSWLRETGAPSVTAGSPWPSQPSPSGQFPQPTEMANHRQSTETVAVTGAPSSAGLWTKVVSCAATRPAQVSRKLAELAEWALVQPAGLLHNQLAGFGPHSTPERVTNPDQRRLNGGCHLQGVIVPIFKLCLVILVMNFLFRLADNCSSALIELLTMSKTTSTDSPSESSLAGDQPLQPSGAV